MMGSITFFTGPMFCGKSDRLIFMLNRYRIMKRPRVCLQPSTDTRTDTVHSRNGTHHTSLRVNPDDLPGIRAAIGDAAVVGLDEFHFFPVAVVPLLHKLMFEGRHIIVAGLDADFRGQSFPSAVALMAIPDVRIERMRAVCNVCDEDTATRSQRLVNGTPAAAGDDTIVVEGSRGEITYEARCPTHHVVR